MQIEKRTNSYQKKGEEKMLDFLIGILFGAILMWAYTLTRLTSAFWLWVGKERKLTREEMIELNKQFEKETAFFKKKKIDIELDGLKIKYKTEDKK
jgi:hypothetical protein